MLRALFRASQWAAAPENRAELAALLPGPDYRGTPAATIRLSLEGRLVRQPTAGAACAVPVLRVRPHGFFDGRLSDPDQLVQYLDESASTQP